MGHKEWYQNEPHKHREQYSSANDNKTVEAAETNQATTATEAIAEAAAETTTAATTQ